MPDSFVYGVARILHLLIGECVVVSSMDPSKGSARVCSRRVPEGLALYLRREADRVWFTDLGIVTSTNEAVSGWVGWLGLDVVRVSHLRYTRRNY